MIKTYDFEQGTPEWFEIRKGKLTASSYGKVVSSRKVKYASLAKDPRTDALEVSPRATKQWELIETLQDEGRTVASVLNASALKTLVEKGVVTIDEENYGCVLNQSAAISHIDNILADIYYTHDDLQPDSPSFAMERGTRLEEIARIDFEMRHGIEVQEVGFITNSEVGKNIGCSPDGLIDGMKGGLEIKCPMPATHLSYHRMNILPPVYKAQVHGCMAVTGADYWWFTSFCPNIKDFTLKVYRDEYTENLSRCLTEFSELLEEYKTLTQNLQTK